MRRLFLALAVILAPALASAQTTQTRVKYKTPQGSLKLLSAVALNASAGLRTVTVPTGGYSRVTWHVDLTRVAATTLTMTCKASLNNGTTFADVTSMDVASGVGTLTPFTWSLAVSANASAIIDMSVGTYDFLRCAFGGASAGGSDLVDVYATAGAP